MRFKNLQNENRAAYFCHTFTGTMTTGDMTQLHHICDTTNLHLGKFPPPHCWHSSL